MSYTLQVAIPPLFKVFEGQIDLEPATVGLALEPPPVPIVQWREQSEGYVHRLKVLNRSLGNIMRQTAHRRSTRGRHRFNASGNIRGVDTCHQTGRHCLDVPLHAGDLARE